MFEGLSIFLLGMVNSATACSFSCMIYLTPFLLDGSTAQDSKKYQGLKRGGSFFAGKSVVYIIVAALSASAGMQVEKYFKDYGKWISGTAIVMIGLISLVSFLFTKNLKTCRSIQEKKMIPLFFLGASTSAIFCPAVLFLIGVSVNSGSMWLGMIYGILFSLGTSISPALIYSVMGVEIGKALHEASRRFYRAIVIFSRLMLIGLGLKTIIL